SSSHIEAVDVTIFPWAARLMPTPPPSYRKRRRALELLEASLDGCTETIMPAHGFKIELLVELVRVGLATASTERMLASGRPIAISGLKMRGAGRGALAQVRWP